MGNDLRDVKLNELSLVKRGANQGARVVLVKHDKGEWPDTYQNSITKRAFTADERKAAAKDGAAMSDGSFPIANETDFHNAVGDVGRASDPAAARAHIKQRAKALGLGDKLPPEWMKSIDAVASALAHLAKKELDGEGTPLTEAIAKATETDGEIEEIGNAFVGKIYRIGMNEDASEEQISSDLGVSVGQFMKAIRSDCPDAEESLQKLLTENPETSEFFTAGDPGHRSSKGDPMSLDPKVQKAIDDAVAAATAETKKALEAANAEIEKLSKSNMPADHQAFADKLSGEAKKKFMSMSPDDRSAECKKAADIEKAGEEELRVGDQTIKKSVVGAGVFEVLKTMHSTISGQAAEISKAKDDREESALVMKAKKDYPNLPGEALAQARLLRAIEKVDPESKKTAEAIFKAANEALGERLREHGGGSNPSGDSAEAELNALAKGIEKDEKVPFSKAYDLALTRNPKVYDKYLKEKEQRTAARA